MLHERKSKMLELNITKYTASLYIPVCAYLKKHHKNISLSNFSKFVTACYTTPNWYCQV